MHCACLRCMLEAKVLGVQMVLVMCVTDEITDELYPHHIPFSTSLTSSSQKVPCD